MLTIETYRSDDEQSNHLDNCAYPISDDRGHVEVINDLHPPAENPRGR